jgi:lysozyme
VKPETLQRLSDQLIAHEGMELRLYKCPAGKWSIGAGRNLQDRGITEDEARHLLNNDIRISIDELTNTFRWFTRLDETRQAAMVELHFNLGLSNLKTFTKTLGLIAEAVEGRVAWHDVGRELLNSKWADQVGRRSQVIADMLIIGDVE